MTAAAAAGDDDDDDDDDDNDDDDDEKINRPLCYRHWEVRSTRNPSDFEG